MNAPQLFVYITSMKEAVGSFSIHEMSEVD